MRKAFILVLLVGLTGGLILAGCGGDDGGGDAPTNEEFIAEADAICAEGDNEIAVSSQETFGNQPPQNQQEAEDFATEVVLPNIQSQLDQIRELTPPEGDEDEVNAILDAAQEGVDAVEEDPSLATQGNDAGGSFAESTRLAQEYGLTACGS